MKFEWDRQKAASNLQKHGEPFTEAVTVLPIRLLAYTTILIIRPENIARSSSDILREVGCCWYSSPSVGKQ